MLVLTSLRRHSRRGISDVASKPEETVDEAKGTVGKVEETVKGEEAGAPKAEGAEPLP